MTTGAAIEACDQAAALYRLFADAGDGVAGATAAKLERAGVLLRESKAGRQAWQTACR